jgi:molybdopterin/thiamine biosynthesis adenylyltransferase
MLNGQLSDEERARYEWQMWTADVGVAGQQKLKSASVLVSRIGGVGGCVAMSLAAAGIGKLILAHAGNIRPSDLNRQLLMTTDRLETPRIDSAVARLQALNPHVVIETIGENLNDENAAVLIQKADVIVDAAPLFSERFAMNRESVRQRKPLVECAMYDLNAQLTVLIPGQTPCLRCLYPDDPPDWKRQFPVFGAVAGTIGSMAAVEVIKLLTGIAPPLAGQLLMINLRSMDFRKLPIRRNPNCPVCSHSHAP